MLAAVLNPVTLFSRFIITAMPIKPTLGKTCAGILAKSTEFVPYLFMNIPQSVAHIYL
jgi:hypothetical protein